MVRFVCAVLLLAVAAVSASQDRIVGGIPATVDEYPSLVQVQRSLTGIWRQSCAGSILTSRYVVTAASCFIGPDGIVRLRRIIAGSSIRNEAGQYSGVARVIKHPSWNVGADYDGDIAILLLETPLQYSNVVQQGRILGQGAYVPDNLSTVQLGWGATFNENFPAIYSRTLQKVNALTVNNARCNENYGPLPVTPNMLCAAAAGQAGACIGDKGGPLFYTDIIVGVASWRVGCTNATLPTVYTAISSYTNWIIDNAV